MFTNLNCNTGFVFIRTLSLFKKYKFADMNINFKKFLNSNRSCFKIDFTFFLTRSIQAMNSRSLDCPLPRTCFFGYNLSAIRGTPCLCRDSIL